MVEEEGGRKNCGGEHADKQSPLALPSDSVCLHFTPRRFVSEDGAMMNRPVQANLADQLEREGVREGEREET